MTGPIDVTAPVTGTLLAFECAVGQIVALGQCVALIESMKMEHVVNATASGRVLALCAAAGEGVEAGNLLLKIEQQSVQTRRQTAKNAPENIDPSLADLWARQALTADAARPEAVTRRHAQGSRTARENVADAFDGNPFVELGALAYAAQTQRRPVDELRAQTPADGLVVGIGPMNTALFGPSVPTQVAVMAYDATVLAGTQGLRNHQKTDRLLQLALKDRLPVLLFAEGGGGRPGDVDMPMVAGLHVGTFAAMARLHGQVSVVAVVHGRCFAGNAALAGMADVLIGTASCNLGLGGPAMVEGGGLGRFAPEAIGPASVQMANGVLDILATDEAHATGLAKKAIAYFQGCLPEFETPAVAARQGLRELVPRERARGFDSMAVLGGVVDVGSELVLGQGLAVHTVLARMAGRPVGVIISNPQHLGGALDAATCTKLARFLRLCQAQGLPVLSFLDTPGFMVGPDAEAQGQVRAAGDLFWACGALTVPVLCITLRRAYGLGAMAMAGGGFLEPRYNAAWPRAEFGAMGLEGAVRLGFRKELQAQPTEAARQALFEALLAQQVAQGRAQCMAETLEIDAVIDPADTREQLLAVLARTVSPNQK